MGSLFWEWDTSSHADEGHARLLHETRPDQTILAPEKPDR